jgi:hypothetical protein
MSIILKTDATPEPEKSNEPVLVEELKVPSFDDHVSLNNVKIIDGEVLFVLMPLLCYLQFFNLKLTIYFCFIKSQFFSVCKFRIF